MESNGNGEPFRLSRPISSFFSERRDRQWSESLTGAGLIFISYLFPNPYTFYGGLALLIDAGTRLSTDDGRRGIVAQPIKILIKFLSQQFQARK